MPLREGEQVGPYVVGPCVGSGGMGRVYRATDTRLRRYVALKVILEGRPGDPAEHSSRLEREARAAASLNHPNIVAVFDVGTHDRSAYVVTELLEGQSLTKLLATPLPAERVGDLAAQLAAGLVAAHEKGVVHRDLKPDNIFVTHDGRLKILDFGIARTERQDPGTGTATDHTDAGAVLGTVGYMAPEQIRGKPVDARADVFAFGCVVYEMLTGRRAFSGATPVETSYAILNFQPAPLPQTVPQHLVEVVRRCLEKPVDARLDSKDLPALLRAGPAFAPGPVEARPKRRLPGALASAAAIVALVVSGGWVYLGALPRDPRVKFELSTPFEGSQAWLTGASRNMFARALAHDRRLKVGDDAANVALRVEIARDASRPGDAGPALSLRAFARRLPLGRERLLVSASGSSVRELYQRAMPGLSWALAGVAPPPAWSKEELELAKRLGTEDVEAALLLRDGVECSWETLVSDVEPCRQIFDAIKARAPDWPMAKLFLAELTAGSPDARAATDEGLRRCADDSSRLDCRLLRAFCGKATADEARSWWAAIEDDPHASVTELILSLGALTALLTEQTVGRANRLLWERAPELQFGSIPGVDGLDPGLVDVRLAKWAERSPESLPRLIHAATRLGERGQADEAARLFEDGMLLHGLDPGLCLNAIDFYASRGEFSRAKELGLQLGARPSRFVRALAYEKLGYLDVLEGRFQRGTQTLRAGLELSEPFGSQAWPESAMETLRAVALETGAPLKPNDLRWVNLRAAWADHVENAALMLYDYDFDAQATHCPALSRYFDQLKGSHDEIAGRRLLIRHAAALGCESCTAAVNAGFDPETEYFDLGLVEFAACATQLKQSDLALRAYEALPRDRFAHSALHQVLGRYRRAQLLDELGRATQAVEGYRDFLLYWRDADHPTPERAAAEKAVARLTSH